MTNEPISQEEIDALLRGVGLGGSSGAGRWEPLRQALADALAAAWSAAPQVLGAPVEAGALELREEGADAAAGALGGDVLWGRLPVGDGEAYLLIPGALARVLVQLVQGGEAPAELDEAGTATLQEILSQLLSRGMQRLLEVTGVQESLGAITVADSAPEGSTPLLVCRQELRVGPPVTGSLALALPLPLAQLLLTGPGLARAVGAAAAGAESAAAGAGAAAAGGGAAPAGGQPAAPSAGGSAPSAGTRPGAPASAAGESQPQVSYRPVQFEELEPEPSQSGPVETRNLELLMDVTLQVTVELGRTQRQIRDVLALAPGSVLELEKLAGEPVEVLVNGKLIARGEVVVIDEHFGVRITDIISPAERAASLGR